MLGKILKPILLAVTQYLVEHKLHKGIAAISIYFQSEGFYAIL